MTKVALPVLVLLIFGLFLWSVTSLSSDSPPDQAAPPVAQAQSSASPEEPKQDREQQLGKTIDGIRAELKQLSDDVKANSDKIAQASAVRSDLQESKSSSDKADQSLLEQVDALRSDQAKFLKDARETSDKTAQALRQELAASEAKVADQIGNAVKADTARSEALAQRVDAMKKDIDEVKKNLDEDRQNVSTISPGFALIIALVALILGPYLANQLTKNHLAAAKRQQAAEASAPARPPAARTRETDPPLVPPAAAEPHEMPSRGEDASPHGDADAHRQAAPDSEKV